MKRNVLLAIAFSLSLVACEDGSIDDLKPSTATNPPANADQSSAWTRLADYPGKPNASYGIQFSIGNKVYMGSGAEGLVMNDLSFWEYDTETGKWTQKTYGGSAFSEMASFSIGDKGYSVAGGHGEVEYLYTNAVSEYDPATDTWTSKSRLPADGRRGAAGFSIGNKGYVGLGRGLDREGEVKDLYFSDFWEYSQAGDCWTRKKDFPGQAGYPSTSFTLGKFGYILTPASSSNFWRYDPKSDSWAKMANFPGIPRTGAVGFGILGKAYVGTGYEYLNPWFSDFWEYDPSTDKWLQLEDFPGPPTSGAFGVSIGTKGYLKTGDTKVTTFYEQPQLWEFDPSK